MTKILFYSINDGNSDYLKCLNIAYHSLVSIFGDITFQIFTDHNGYEKISESDTVLLNKTKPVNKVVPNWQYIGDLKYHKQIFQQNYDYFIYFDSDILWKYPAYNFIDNLVSFDGFKINEGKICRSDEQHTLSWTQPEIDSYQNHRGVNAGLFCLKKDIAMDLAEFFITEVGRHKLDSKDISSQGKIEQSLFNKFIICNNFYDKLLTMNDNVVNMYTAQDLALAKENLLDKIYHFMSFGQGATKLEFMSSIS